MTSAGTPPLGARGAPEKIAATLRLFAVVLALFALASVPSLAAEQVHRATRLGNPATRFADPLKTPEDLQNMLRSERLRTDVDFIARESGFAGDMADLRRAADVSNIRPLQIPVGMRLRAMSTRRNGRPVLLREVLWAGDAPIDAYEFHFVSRGRLYRVVAPKPCANFWVEDRGREMRSALTLSCDAPDEVPLGRSVTVCLTLTNTGDVVEPLTTVTLPIPPGAALRSATMDGKETDGHVRWEFRDLAPGASHQVCAVFTAAHVGPLPFASTAQGTRAPQVPSRCETRVVGVPAVLLEVVDVKDPIEVGEEQTYEITALNQGTAVLTNVMLTCTTENSQRFSSGTGTTAVHTQGETIVTERMAALAPKEKATWRVTVKALAPGDVRFLAELTCDQFQQPIRETEATQQY